MSVANEHATCACEPATAQQVLDRLIEARIVARRPRGSGYNISELQLTDFGEALVKAACTDDQAGALSSYMIRGLMDDASVAAPVPPGAK